MLAEIRDILFISTPHGLPRFKSQLVSGSNYGVRVGNAAFVKEKGKVFLPLPMYSPAELDIYFLPINNYEDIVNAKRYYCYGPTGYSPF